MGKLIQFPAKRSSNPARGFGCPECGAEMLYELDAHEVGRDGNGIEYRMEFKPGSIRCLNGHGHPDPETRIDGLPSIDDMSSRKPYKFAAEQR